MSKSPHVCAHCGLAVYTWASQNALGGYVWKHATGGRGPKACDRPTPVKREVYERDMNATFANLFPWRK